jgi:predicted metal-dependent HD superfamily phosphohydrolase
VFTASRRVDNGGMPSPAHPDADLAAALLGRWTSLLQRVRPGGQPEPAPYGEQLLRRWSEPQRRYHTLRHLDAMLATLDALADGTADTDTVRLATWFHDAVYAPERSENEERSARLAERVLAELGLDEALTAEVARLVRLTAEHDPAPGDANGALLCDADLAVLGGSPESYAAYAAAVREEYAFVPEEGFRAGRAAVLRQLLGLPGLFRTEPGRRAFEAAARRNMEAELAGL